MEDRYPYIGFNIGCEKNRELVLITWVFLHLFELPLYLITNSGTLSELNHHLLYSY